MRLFLNIARHQSLLKLWEVLIKITSAREVAYGIILQRLRFELDPAFMLLPTN